MKYSSVSPECKSRSRCWSLWRFATWATRTKHQHYVLRVSAAMRHWCTGAPHSKGLQRCAWDNHYDSPLRRTRWPRTDSIFHAAPDPVPYGRTLRANWVWVKAMTQRINIDTYLLVFRRCAYTLWCGPPDRYHRAKRLPLPTASPSRVDVWETRCHRWHSDESENCRPILSVDVLGNRHENREARELYTPKTLGSSTCTRKINSCHIWVARRMCAKFRSLYYLFPGWDFLPIIPLKTRIYRLYNTLRL